MDKVWEIDGASVVEAKFGAFGGKLVKLNGQEVHNGRKIEKGQIPFALPDGRRAAISVKSQLVGGPEIDLRVDGKLVVETGKEPIKCPACGTVAKPYDRFCGKCGNAMPSAEHYQAQRHVKHATGAIKILSALFLISGILMYFVTKGQADATLAQLQGAEAGATYEVQGRTYTVEQLRETLQWEPKGVLIVNLVLAAIMVALAWWGRRAPLAAVLVATAAYAVVIVTNAIADPATLGQGIILKIIIIAFLVKGIKAALALRASNA
ncbi:MAG: zinc ribbon domain-containing protein [Burkholderiales bacterium]